VTSSRRGEAEQGRTGTEKKRYQHGGTTCGQRLLRRSGIAGVGGLLMFCLLVPFFGLRDFLARTIISVRGYLQPRPDPWLDAVLRDVFLKFEQELEFILSDYDARNSRRPEGGLLGQSMLTAVWPDAYK
jgi:hypothetical protein